VFVFSLRARVPNARIPPGGASRFTAETRLLRYSFPGAEKRRGKKMARPPRLNLGRGQRCATRMLRKPTQAPRSIPPLAEVIVRSARFIVKH